MNHINLSWWEKMALDSGSEDNGTSPGVPKCEQYVIRHCFTARPEGKVL